MFRFHPRVILLLSRIISVEGTLHATTEAKQHCFDKLIKAAKQTGIREITIGGGVSANSGLRNRIEEEGRKHGWNTYLPEFKFTTDNAAMIAIAGYFHYQAGERTALDVAPVSRIADF